MKKANGRMHLIPVPSGLSAYLLLSASRAGGMPKASRDRWCGTFGKKI